MNTKYVKFYNWQPGTHLKRLELKVDILGMETLSDEQLISLAAGGNNQALEILVARNLKLVYSFVYRYVQSRADAEDVTQEIFIKIWKNLRRFDLSKPFRPWLYQIAKNTCLDFFKKRNELPFSALQDQAGEDWLAQNIPDNSLLPETAADQALLAEKYAGAVRKLSPEYAEAVLLRHNYNLKFKEISRQTKTSLNTVKSRYRRAILLLRNLMKE